MKLSKRRLMLIAMLLIFQLLIMEVIFRPRVIGQSLASSLYNLKQYALADTIHAKNAARDDDLAAANLAKSKYRLGDYESAMQAGDDALQNNPHSASRNYDAGNAAYRAKDYEKALEHYRQAMLANPGDVDAKANYELTQKMLQKQDKQQPDDKPQPQQDEQKQEDIRNILEGLDSKESSDRKQKEGSGAAGGDKWW